MIRNLVDSMTCTSILVLKSAGHAVFLNSRSGRSTHLERRFRRNHEIDLCHVGHKALVGTNGLGIERRLESISRWWGIRSVAVTPSRVEFDRFRLAAEVRRAS